MRKLLLALLLVIPLEVSGQSKTAPPMPRAVKSLLNQTFPGWKFAETAFGVEESLKQARSNARPEIIKGDFDGNKKTDCALLIKHGKLRGENGEIVDDRTFIAVLLQGRRGYRIAVLKHAGDYLALGRKGEYGFDWHKNRKFQYQTDVIESGYYEKAAWSYVYRKGRFRYIYSLD